MKAMIKNLQKISEAIENIDKVSSEIPEFNVFEYSINDIDMKSEKNLYDLCTKNDFDYLTPSNISSEDINTLTVSLVSEASDAGSFAWNIVDEWRNKHENEEIPDLIKYCIFSYAEEQMIFFEDFSNNASKEVRNLIQPEIDTFPQYITSGDTVEELYNVIDTAKRIEDIISKNFPDLEICNYHPELLNENELHRDIGFEVEINNLNEATVYVTYANSNDAMLTIDEIGTFSKDDFLNNSKAFDKEFTKAWNNYVHNLNCLRVQPEKNPEQKTYPTM